MIGGLLLFFFRSEKIVRGQWCPLAWHFYRAIAMELPPAVMEADCDEFLAASSSIELPPSISEERQDAGPTKKKAKSVRTGKTNRTQPLQPFPVPSLCLPDPVESDTLLTYWSSLGVELPEAVDLGDDSDDHDDFFVLETIVEDKAKKPLKVPTPLELAAMKNPLKQLAVEYYSPPRVLPHIGSCKCFLSLDLLTGWDFTDAKNQSLSMEALQKYDVDMCVLSPPCTMFSALQILFSNFEKLDPAVFKKRWGEAEQFIAHSMEVAEHQIHRRKYFAFEHPRTASSWKLEAVEKIRSYSQVGQVHFDQCMLGLASPSGKLFKKRTTIMSNHPKLLADLAKYQCNKAHEHQPIIGQEKGRSRSWWAQHYPPALCKILACAAETS